MGDIIPTNWVTKKNDIKVIGVGGGGNNAVHNMYAKQIEGVDFVICNTDAQIVNDSPVPYKIQIGAVLTGGEGAGCDPEKGKAAALENIEEIRKVLTDTKMVFITAGLGGGTGTGAAPIIAEEAKKADILTVAIVTMPFDDEGEEPKARAIAGLNELKPHVDSLLLIDNPKIYEIYGDLPVKDAFPKADEIVTIAAKSIAEIITKKGYINVDFADVKKVMTNSGLALMGLGSASGEQRAQKAVHQALDSPLLFDRDIAGAKSILVNITSKEGDKPLLASELKEIMKEIQDASGGKAWFKRGVTFDESLTEEISVTIIATGFKGNYDYDGTKINIDDDFMHDFNELDTATDNTDTNTATGFDNSEIDYDFLEDIPAIVRNR